MGIGTALIARAIVARRFDHNLKGIDPIAGGSWRVGFVDRPEVVDLNHRLVEIRRIDLPIGHEFRGRTEMFWRDGIEGDFGPSAQLGGDRRPGGEGDRDGA